MSAIRISGSLLWFVLAAAVTESQAAPRFIELGILPSNQPYTATTLGDIGVDGREDLVTAGSDIFKAGNVAVWDFGSGASQWLSPAYNGGWDDPFRIATQTIDLARRAGHAPPRIVLSGAYNASRGPVGHVVVIEPPTMTPVLQVGGYAIGMFCSVKAAELYDWNDDGNDELITLEGVSFWSPAWPRLRVLSLDDGTALWTSDGFGGPFAEVRNVFVLPGDSSAADTFVASTTTELYAFGRTASSAVWQLSIANEGAAYVAHGVAGPEIVLIAPGGGLIFLDAKTRATLRSFSIDASFHSIQALGGDVGSLLAAVDDVLLLIDGRTGALLATSAALGSFDLRKNRIGAAYQGGGVWHLAPATELATYRYRLELTEKIFRDDFEATP